MIGALNQAPHRDRRDAFLGARPLQLSRPSCNLLSAICLLNILERVSSWVGFELFRAFSELRAAQLRKAAVQPIDLRKRAIAFSYRSVAPQTPPKLHGLRLTLHSTHNSSLKYLRTQFSV